MQLTVLLAFAHADYEATTFSHLTSRNQSLAAIFGDSQTFLTLGQSSWLSISAFYSGIASYFFALAMGNLLGRKPLFLFSLGLALVGAIVETATMGYGQTVAARVILGFGYGLQIVAGPVWIVESVGSGWRGAAVVGVWVGSVFGGQVARWLGFAWVYVPGEVGFRVPLALQFVFLVPAVVVAVLAPESGRWEVLKGKSGAGGLSGEGAATAGSSVAVKGPRRWRRLVLGVALQCMVPLTGRIAVSLSVMLSGWYNVDLELMQTMLGLVTLLLTLASIGLVDRFGRRKLLVFAAVGQAICWIPLTVCNSFSSPSGRGSDTLDNVATAFIFFWTACYAVGFMAIPVLYATEINTTPFRFRGLAGSWILRSGFDIMMSYTYFLGLYEVGYGYLIIWLVLNALFAAVVWAFYPEPAGRTLEQVDGLFGQLPAWYVGSGRKEATSVLRPGKRDVETSSSSEADVALTRTES
ncbi:hypothetical protein MBLNU230_g7341t1 [Neophaeotheca triangularis]